MDKVTDYTGSPWTIEAVEKLKKLWNEDVPAEMISQTLARPENVVRAKAAELGLPQHVESK
jgi:hypothetical protein